ncbi:MAG: hypothetical protein ACE5HV_01025 [Acidobacteriota bacterium]
MKEPATPALVDGHVHYHGCYRAEAFLSGAATNISRAAKELGLASNLPGFLLFCEAGEDDYFRHFRDRTLSAGDWQLQATAERCSVVARNSDGACLFLVAGRQVVTEEHLEVLALCTAARMADGKPLGKAIEAILDGDGAAVIPWGFGKWWGRRGAVVAELLESPVHDRIFLGDNGGRPRLGPRPRLFDVARSRQVPILPGSDPLPFPWQQCNAGRRGFVAQVTLDEARPAASIRGFLRRLRQQPLVYGKLETLPRFCRNQLAMLLRRKPMPADQPIEGGRC